MKLIPSVLLCTCLILAAQQSDAQVFDRTWRAISEPSNELPRTIKKVDVQLGWLCYDGRTGFLQTDCPVTFKLRKTIGGPGVTNACTPDADGRIPRLTCGNGGHTHLEDDRPVIFKDTEVRYPNADPEPMNDPLSVSGPSPGGFFGFEWTVPQAGGIYDFESTMTASPGGFFATFRQGGLFFVSTLTARGSLNVTVARDSLRQLPDLPNLYLKKRRGPPPQRLVGADTGHFDNIAYAATKLTRAVLPLIAIEYSVANNGDKIEYNDISLPKGGVFDFTAYDQSLSNPDRWKDPHESHREGIATDVNWPGADSCAIDKSVEFAVDKLLARNVARNRSALYCELTGNYHIDTTSLQIAGQPVPFP